ncbi:hypothetical protein MMC30_000397 [Trapelia coarctata]|nr:hypothetical protein [Trapelia coarctata]
MFQRLKGAIDSRIAEEQARQRASQSLPSRSNSGARKPPSRSSSPAVRAARNRQAESKGGDPTQKGPDPKEFEPDFVIDDEDLPSRTVTPKPAQEKNGEAKSIETAADKALGGEGSQQAKGEKGSGEASLATTTAMEVPTDVRVKLRKLEKLEARYHELLRSYRIAHARVTAIEPFENTLRENTPLTSINDPGALVEYLNQLNLKGDMVLDELKRVSAERSNFKEKLEEAEKRTRETWDEVTKLQEANNTNGDKDDGQEVASHATAPESTDEPQGATGNLSEAEPVAAMVKSPTSSIKSYTPSIPGLSIFSPKSKPIEIPQPGSEAEEFFSYDSELPRLENELKESQNEISKLNREMTSLKDDLAVARESTQNMVKSLEDATRDLNTLREQKDRCELDLDQQRLASEKTINRLQSDLEAADGKLRQLQMQQSSEDGKTSVELERSRAEVSLAEKKIQELLAEKDKAIANATQLQLHIDDLHADVSGLNLAQDQNAKRIKTLHGLVENLREQLIKADEERIRTKSTANEGQGSVKSLQPQPNIEGTTTNGVTAEAKPLSEPNASKKKNKKKKKVVKASVDQDAEAVLESLRLAEKPATTATVVEAATTKSSETVAKLEEELKSLHILLGEKDAAIERLHGKLKGEEEMREEIESLRDELVNVGQEHVEAKDRIKDLIAEKSVLEKTASELEKELSDLRTSREFDIAGSEQAQKDLAAQFEDLKLKATNLQTDLSVAQQLASSRFKDLTDLRTILQKAQPELTALRTENSELKALKEELSTKITELQKTEARHNILRSELTDLKKATSTKDAEMKILVQKLDQESTARQRSEEASSRSNQDLQRSESEKKALVQSLEKASKDLAQSREELNNMRARVQELENSLSLIERESDGLKEDIELKTAQHASAESLMSSMRDQTAEMAMQTKEARERCESLEEELADAHRLLSERSREGETLRRLLTEVEARAETRVREMKERMDVALEERDKAEDEASTASRRRVRELEEVRNKLKDVERNLRRVEEDKEELEVAQRDWKKRREDLEQKAEQSTREAEDVRRAMSELQDALDESERQACELEKQKVELRHSLEDTQLRLDKVQKSNKAMSEELRLIQVPKTRPLDSQGQSPRSSIDSTPSRAKLASPGPKSRAISSVPDSGPPTPSIDFVYLKNILLQFLEQKDKKHQMQLIPVLGMLLHFDRKDEQKWMAAITTK